MRSEAQREEDKRRWQAKAEEMYDELSEWRVRHPEASFDEIGHQVTPRRQELMGDLMSQLALHHGSGEEAEGLVCEECGQELKYKGQPGRGVAHLEGEARIKRAYYHCAHCAGGIFPPGSAAKASETQLESGDDPTGGGLGDSDSLLWASGHELSVADQDADVQE
jgi:hypothetical protein